MEKFKTYLFVALLLPLMFISCIDDPIDEDDPEKEIEGELIPPDTEAVEAWYEGEISETEFDEGKGHTTVFLNRLPHTLEKFLEMKSQIDHTPQGAVAMMIVAFSIYQKYPDEGMKCLTANSTYPLTVETPNEAEAYEGYKMANTSELKRKLNDYSYLPMVYMEGASPENGYTPSGPPYKIEMTTNLYSYTSSGDGSIRVKLFVKTLGADSPRPVVVRKVNNRYKITEYSSLYLAPKNTIK